jgi:cysteine desulfurase
LNGKQPVLTCYLGRWAVSCKSIPARDKPGARAMIYLDNSATTAVREEVRNAMLPWLSGQWGNPGSIHDPGQQARQAVEKARTQVAALLNASPSEIYFTPCATYSNNAAILGRARFVEVQGGGKHLITSAIEHPSCLGPAKFLEANGWDVTYLGVDANGLVSPAALQRVLKPDTAIVSLMWANNEIGSVFPVEELAAVAHERGIFFHTDAVQVPGKLPIDLALVEADTLALSGHKFYAPKGIGILFKRAGVELRPIFHGGGQEGALFPGTEPVANIVAIGQAAELAHEEVVHMQRHLREMQKILMDRLLSVEGVRITGPSDIQQRLPGHVSVVVPGIEGEAAVLQCDLKNLCISSASACHKGIMQPSHVVSALRISSDLAMGSLRISAGRFNTAEQVNKAADALLKVIASLRKAKTPAL